MDDVDKPEETAAGAFGDPRAVCMRWVIPPDCHERTVEEALAHKVRRLGLERARSVVASGDLRVDGLPLLPGARLHKGMTVELWRLAPDDPSQMVEEPRILLQQDGLVVVDKPGDLTVHPSARYLHVTLTGWLRRRGLRANPCHRLDRETSGVLICAEPGDVERRIKTAFMRGAVDKEYLAVVRGRMDAACTIDAPLALQAERGLVRIRMVADPAGQPARTDVEPLFHDVTAARTLLLCRPRTGRQHQIRAHLALVGAPLVGDKLYAMGDAWFDGFTRRALSDTDRAALDHRRQALHAARVTLTDDGARFSSPLPDELRALLPDLPAAFPGL